MSQVRYTCVVFEQFTEIYVIRDGTFEKCNIHGMLHAPACPRQKKYILWCTMQ